MHFGTIKLCWALLERRHRRQLIFLVLLMLFSSVMELLSVAAVPGFVMAISQAGKILASNRFHEIFQSLGILSARGVVIAAGLGLVFIFLLRALVFIFMIWRQSSTISEVAQSVSGRLFERYLFAKLEVFSNRNTSQYAQVVFSEVERLTAGYLLPVLAVIMNVAVSVAMIMLILIVNPVSALGVGVITACTAYIFMRLSRTRVRWHGDEVSQRTRWLNQTMNEGLGSIKHVRLRGAENEIMATFGEHLERRRFSARALFFSASLSKPVFETTAIFALVLLTFALMLQTKSLDTIVPTLALLGAIAVRMLPTLNHMTQMLVAINANESAVTSIVRDFSTFSKDSSADLQQPLTLEGDISLENIYFQFPGQDANVINGVNLHIERNSSVAFVGPTGSGKSTLVDIAIGLLVPTSGQVKVAGTDISENLAGWQRQVGYIPQAIYLTDTSIRHNVALGVPENMIDDQAVWKALELAQLADMVRENPAGLDATVGERGVRMSGGQRQRIGIARALYFNPNVLVLDEATAALDNITEANIMAAVETAKAGRTLIMIAHRLTTIRNCDRIFYIKEGSVVASGTYDELMRDSTDFSALARAQ